MTRRVIPTPLTFRSPDSNSKIRIPGSVYNARIARAICERLMQGEALMDICEDPRMPSKRTVIRWLADPRLADFREMYYFARRVAAEIRIDEIFEIADNTNHDWTEVRNSDGELVALKPNNEAIQRSRVRIDTRKWYAMKMMPKIYGDKTQVELDATGDLAELLRKASNKTDDLPPPIDGEAEKVG